MTRTGTLMAVRAVFTAWLSLVASTSLVAQSGAPAPQSSPAVDPWVAASAENVFYKLQELSPRPLSLKKLAELLPKLHPEMIQAALEYLTDDGRITRRGKGTTRDPFRYAVRVTRSSRKGRD